MPVYIRCPYCKSDQNVKNKVCRKCGKELPKRDKVFVVRVQHNGRVVTQTIMNSLTVAREIEAKIKQELVAGEYYDRRKKAKQEIKLDEFFQLKYMPAARNEKKSYDREEQMYRDYIQPVIGSKRLNNISPFDVEKIKKKMASQDLAPRTIEYTLAVLRHVINKAKDWGYFEGDNPVSKVKKPKVNNRRVRFLTPEEAKALLAEVKKRSQQTYEICLLSLYTGMRAGEIFNLKFADVDLENAIIHIKNPKSGEDRVAYITDEIRSIFESKRGKPDEYVFKDTNGKRIDKVSRTFFRAVKKLGLNDGVVDPKDKVVFHTLRHTFASWLVMQGTPIYVVKELMGHKTLAMTERYSHLAPDSKRQTAASISNMLKTGSQAKILVSPQEMASGRQKGSV